MPDLVLFTPDRERDGPDGPDYLEPGGELYDLNKTGQRMDQITLSLAEMCLI